MPAPLQFALQMCEFQLPYARLNLQRCLPAGFDSCWEVPCPALYICFVL